MFHPCLKISLGIDYAQELNRGGLLRAELTGVMTEKAKTTKSRIFYSIFVDGGLLWLLVSVGKVNTKVVRYITSHLFIDLEAFKDTTMHTIAMGLKILG